MAPNFYVPQMVFIDRKGTIRAQYGGAYPFLSSNEEKNIRETVEKLLSESGGPAKTSSRPSKPAKKG